MILEIPPYAPDLSDYEARGTLTLLNVLPRSDGYGPVPAFQALSAALPAACRGYFYARKNDGSVAVFAGTSTRLWLLNNSDLSWIPVSKVLALTSISNASPAIFTLVAHGLSIGDAIVLSTSGGLPTGLVVGTVYYVIAAGFTANAFEVALTPAGAAINTSSAGSGTHSFTSYYSAVPTADQWQFAQFNNFVFAVQTGAVPQVLDLTAPTAFADLAGSPPQARYIAVVNRFLVLSGLTSSTPYRVQWSGFNATTTWTAGVNQSDTYDMPDGGIVRSMAGGEYGIITQDGTIRRMVYSPGSPVIFQFDRISEEKGIMAPLSMVRGGDRVFFYGNDGFQMILPGGYPQPIGKERVDRFFFLNADTASPQYIIGASDPRSGRVFWSFKSAASSVSAFDRLLCYDYIIDKWSLIAVTGEYIATMSAPGLTLENLDSISSSIDSLSFSLDDVSTASLARLSIFNTSHMLGFFSGDNLEATLVTAEKSGDGRRLRVRGFRPVTDAIVVYGSVSRRETLQDMASFSTETLVNDYGVCPANVSTRNARAKLRVPAGEDWTYVTGVEPDVAIEGRR